MIKKTVNKLIGLKKDDFDEFVKSGQISVQPARLIPALKTGDEMALTSIFLTTLRLVKEYRDSFFKEIKLGRFGRIYYYTEACFSDINQSRIDGLILVVTKGVIADAAFFEMKNKSNKINQTQIEAYLDLAKKLKVNKLITISNQFVSDPTQSPIDVRVPKSISLLHFSWTYLVTKGQLLLFKKADDNIEDVDQVEIMAETLHYFENPVSGITGYTQMKAGWKELVENVRAQKPLKQSDEYIKDAVFSFYEEEKDLALLLSRKLGTAVKPFPKKADTPKKDIKRLVDENYLTRGLTIKNAVSDIKIKAEFERRTVSMSIKLTPPLNKGTKARITWIAKQLENYKKRGGELFEQIQKDIWIEADIKYAKEHLKVNLSDLDSLPDLSNGKEIQAFYVVLIRGFSAGFGSTKKFIVLIEEMILQYYEAIVQHASSWTRPSPKISNED